MEQQNKRGSFVVIICLLFAWCHVFGASLAFAEETTDPAGAAGFTYNIEYPDNQTSDKGYYDLLMKPSQSQTVSIELINPSKQPVTVLVGLNGAKTNKNGVVEYGDNSIDTDPSLKFDFEELVKGPESVTIEPGTSKKAEFEIKMPKTSYDGIVLGGIQLIRDDSKDKKEKVTGSQVKNKYMYIVGMTLRNSDKKVTPALELNKVYGEQFNYQNTIYVNYSNVNAAMLEDMSTEVQIMKKGSKTVLYETKKTDMRMAPNTHIDFPVSMNGEKMVAGEYTANILVTGADNIREEWTKDFTITKEEADQFNQRDVGLIEEKGVNWTLILSIAVGSVLFIIVAYTLITNIANKKKQGNKGKSTKRKRK